MKTHWDVTHASPAGDADDATSAWTAGECHMALGQELLAEEEKFRGNLVRASSERELAALRKFKVSNPVP